MMKQISASIRVAMKRAVGTSPPLSKNMSSNSTPLSGMSISSAYCIAFDVRPIFQPRITRPASTNRRTSAACMA